jgi:hypothetical protein
MCTQDKEVDVPVLALLVDEALRCLELQKAGKASHGDETLITQVFICDSTIAL